MSAENMNVNIDLNVQKANRSFEAFISNIDVVDDKLTKAAKSLTDVASSEQKVVEVTKQLINEYRTATTVVTKYGDEVKSITTRIEENNVAKQKAIAIKKQEAAQLAYLKDMEKRYNAEISSSNLSNIKRSEQFDAANKRLVTSITGINAEGQKVAYTFKSYGGTLSDVSKKTTDAAKAMSVQEKETQKLNKSTMGITISFKHMAQIIAIQLVRRAVSSLIAGFKNASNEAIEFEKRIAEIQTISQDMPLTFNEWTASVRKLSNSYGLKTLDAAEAIYETISNQVAKGAEAYEFNAKAADFARVTNSSLADSVNLLSSAINSYGLTSKDAERLSAQFFRTIDLGRLRADEIANVLGRVTVSAADLGVSMNEVNAFLALVTRRGITAKQALTQVRGVLNALMKPTDEMKELFKTLGTDTANATVKAYGFQGILKQIVKETAGSSEKMAKLIPRIRGLDAALSASVNAGAEYDKTLAQVSDTSNYAKSRLLTLETAAKKVESAFSVLSNIWTIDIGVAINKSLANLIGNVDEFGMKAEYVGETFKRWLGYNWKVLQIPIALIDRIAELHTKEEIASLRREKALKAEIEKQTKYYDDIAAAQKESIDKRLKAELLASAEINKKNVKNIKEQTDGFKSLNNEIENIAKNTEKAVKDNLDAITKKIKESQSSLVQLQNFSKSVSSSLQEAILSETLSRQTPNQQIKTIRDQLSKLTDIRKKAESEGQKEIAQETLKQQIELTKKAVSIDKSRVEQRKSIVKDLVELEQKYQKDVSKATTDKEKRKLKADYIAEERKLQAERLKVSDTTTGAIAKDYVSLYSKLIQIAKQQSDNFAEIEKKRIKDLELEEKRSIERIAAYRETINKVLSFDIQTETFNKDAAVVNKILKDRQAQLDNVIEQSHRYNDLSEKNKLIGILNAKKVSEQLIVQNLLAEEKAKKAKEEVDRQAELNKKYAEARVSLLTQAELVKNILGGRTNLKLFTQLGDPSSLVDKLNNLNRIDVSNAIGELASLQTHFIQLQQQLEIIKGRGQERYLPENLITNVSMLNQLLMTRYIDMEEQIQRQNNQTTAQERYNNTLKETIKLQKEMSIKSVRDVSLPPIKRAAGGIAYGRDSVNALLTPGEYVMNASSTRKFYSQLVSMNSKRNSIATMNNGGAVSVGDININMSSSGNESYDIQKIGQGLRREIRRGTLKL